MCNIAIMQICSIMWGDSVSQLGASPVVSVLSEYDDPIFFHVCTTVFNFYCLFIYIYVYIL
jgi:hypothetical protein